MRLSPLVPAALILFMSGPAAAQPPSPQASVSLAVAQSGGGGWLEYTSREDFFIVNFPGEPTVRDITYPTEYGITVPARVYSVGDRSNRYSVTVVDYSTAERIHTERSRTCQGYPDTCTNRWAYELRGALDYAVSTFMQRNANVTYYAYADTDRVEGRRVQLTNADRSRTFVAIYMHDNRLYILDGTAPASTPAPTLFQQSLGFFDKDGVRVRYQTIYRNGYPPPPREETRGRRNGC
jgi:hypothetical protein